MSIYYSLSFHRECKSDFPTFPSVLKMYRFFTPSIVLNLLLFGRSIFGFTNIAFNNNYAIFSPDTNGVRFDLDNTRDVALDILFLEKPEEPSTESSPYKLKIEYNISKNDTHVFFTLYKKGTVKKREYYAIIDAEHFKNLELVWDTPDGMRIQMMMKQGICRSTAFTWEDDQGSPPNITYIGFKTPSSLTIRQKDSFVWISNILTACSHQDVEISCGMNVDRQRLKSMDERNSASSRGLRKVLEMKLISKASNPHDNYEITIAANETTEPRLHIMRHNITKLKMDTIVGPLNLSISIPGGHFTLGSNDSFPFLVWRDPVDKNKHFFENINYVTMKVSESTLSRKSIKNSCKLTCKPKDSSPWYKRWMNKLKNVFSSDDDDDTDSES